MYTFTLELIFTLKHIFLCVYVAAVIKNLFDYENTQIGFCLVQCVIMDEPLLLCLHITTSSYAAMHDSHCHYFVISLTLLYL